MKNRKYLCALAFSLLAAGCAATGYAQEEAGQQMETEDLSSLVASADEMAEPADIVSEDMTPVYADSLNEGTYEIEVLSSSPMFKIIDCQLTVADGEMTAAVTLSSDGYLMLYPGTGAEAVQAKEEDYLTFTLNEEEKQVYEFPVEALDAGLDCAAFSRRKEKWYDRTLVFQASTLPQEALKESTYVTAQELALEDGEYRIAVTLEGGSGRTEVESPTAMTVENGAVTAVITFGSPYYDYMLVDGEKYEPVNTDGNSSFEIPVTAFDWKMAVTADTIAMSTPHEIDYTLYFDSSTIEKVN